MYKYRVASLREALQMIFDDPIQKKNNDSNNKCIEKFCLKRAQKCQLTSGCFDVVLFLYIICLAWINVDLVQMIQSQWKSRKAIANTKYTTARILIHIKTNSNIEAVTHKFYITVCGEHGAHIFGSGNFSFYSVSWRQQRWPSSSF